MDVDRKLVQVGDRHVFKGRIWDAIGVEPYTRKDGTETELAVWQGLCTSCSGPLVVRTPRLVNLSAVVFAQTERAGSAASQFSARSVRANICGLGVHHAPINAPRCTTARAASLTFAPSTHPALAAVGVVQGAGGLVRCISPILDPLAVQPLATPEHAIFANTQKTRICKTLRGGLKP